MYGFKEGVFTRGIYITINSAVEYVASDGKVHQILIRNKKKSIKLIDKKVRVIGINIQTAEVSKFATKQKRDPTCVTKYDISIANIILSLSKTRQ